MSYKLSMVALSKSILKRLKTSSSRNNKVTRKAVEDTIKMLTDDCANNLRDHGRYRIANFGKFEVSQRTGQINFKPYSKFLDTMDFGEGYTGEMEDDDSGEEER